MRSVVVHALLAVFGLCLAYSTFTREPEDAPAPAEVTVLACTPAGFESIALVNPTHRISATPERHGGKIAYRIASARASQKAPAAAESDSDSDAGATAPAKESEPSEKRFLANAAFGEYMQRVLPLRALRALGPLANDKLAEFGFDKVGTRVFVACDGKRVELEVGGRTYGSRQRYVRDAASQTVYLVDEALVADLQSAQFKFMQSDLHDFALSDVDEALVSANGAQKRLLQHDRKSQERATWVDADAPQTRNELYGNFLSRLSRLRARDYLEASASPGSDLGLSGAAQPVLEVSYSAGGKPKGKLELSRVDGPHGVRYYARTETTRGFAIVFESAAKELEQDVRMVVSAQEVPSQGLHEEPASGKAPALPPGHP